MSEMRLSMITTKLSALAIIVSSFVLLIGCKSAHTAGVVGTELAGTKGEFVVVVFTSVDCPIANAMAPQLRRTLESAESRGVRCLLVYPRRSTTDPQRRQHKVDYQLPGRSLSDRAHNLVQVLDARITPEAFVLKLDGAGGWEVLYRGRVNDLYASIGNRRDQPSRHDLMSAIDAALAGRFPVTRRTEAVGCLIER